MDRKRQRIPVYLTQNELNNLLKNIRKDQHKLGIALMGYAGLRVSELCSLRVCDIYLARGYLKILGKGNKERIVPLTNPLQRQVEQYLKRYGSNLTPESFLLGRTRVAWHYVVKKYASANLGRNDIHCHTLRHSFATALYEKGATIERIAELLGHANINTTMIYSHISYSQKKDTVMLLEGKRSRVVRLLLPRRRQGEISVKRHNTLIGREKELEQINGYVKSGHSVLVFGSQGCGKSAILRQFDDAIYIDEYKKKRTIVSIIIQVRNIDPVLIKEVSKELNKLNIDDLIDELCSLQRLIVFDDITALSKSDRRIISKIAAQTTVLASSSKSADKKLFPTFVDVKPLKRYHTRAILSEMIHMNDHDKKDQVISDILHTAGENIKEAEYISNQLQLGKTTDEVVTEERVSNQVSIAPVLLIFVLFFVAYTLKSYATSMVAFSYAMLVVFRLIFYKFIFVPAMRR